MKNKKVVSMCAALGLVAVVGVGGTLAYLSDNTGALTNTFTFTEQGINITLDEAKINEKNQATTVRVEAGYTQEYKNVLPNMIMDKDPTVTVEKNSEECNVFVSVTNANLETTLKITDLDTNSWEEITPTEYGYTAADNTKYYVYKGLKATGTVESGDSFSVVATSENDVILEDVFQHVQAGTNLERKTEFSDIVVKAAAVQADNATDMDAAKTALGLLGATIVPQD